MNSLFFSKVQLIESALRLSAAWVITKEVWHDSACQDFEINYWTDFETTTNASIEKLQVLADTIAQAEREIR